MKQITISIEEMRLLSLVDRERKSTGRIVVAAFELHADDAEALRGLTGERMAGAFVLIGDDEKPVIIEETPEVKKNNRRLTQLGGIQRNDPRYQAVLIEYFMKKPGYGWISQSPRVDPIDRRRITAKIQHQFCGVKSLGDIMPNTREALCLKLLDGLYLADQQGLPPPDMEVNAFQLVANVARENQ